MIHMSRKMVVNSFFMLCVLALAAAPVFGQGVAFQASSLPQQARIEGLTETMGAVVLQATGNGSIPAGSSITVLYSGTITNTPTGASLSGSFQGATVTTCSGTTGAGGCPSQGGTQGSTAGFAVSSSGNQLTVAVTGAAGTYVLFKTGDAIVISQVRVNINALGASVGTVTATMSGTSALPTSNPITFTQSVVPVASVVNPSLTVSRVSSSRTFQTCSIAGGGQAIQVGVTERFPAALTTQADESAFTPAFPPSNGTNVTVSFAGIPSGMAIQLTGTTFTSSLSPSVALTVTPTASAAVTSNGSAVSYTFTVTGDSTSSIDTITLNFALGLPGSTAGTISASAGSLPAIGSTNSVVATVSLGPVQASGVVGFAANTQGTTTVATISDCVTNILFPYVTNQGGYDTSFSIANTSNDDLAFGANLGAAPQSGTCTLSFWPTTDLTQGTPGTALQFNTPSVPTGAVYAFSQSSTSFSGQSGYMIAVCRFLNAHGFAFLTNGFAQATGPQLSHGYLGLVIPNPVSGRTSVNSEVLLN